MSRIRYCSQENVEGVIGRSLSDKEAINIGIYLDAATDFVERLTGRNWQTDANPRYYSGNDSNILTIEPTKDITLIERIGIDGSVLDFLDLSLVAYGPLNDEYKTQIIKHSGRFYCGYGNYRVTGTLSTEIPPAIKLATAMLVADKLGNPSNVKAESIEGYSVTYDNSDHNEGVMDLLNPWIRPLL